MAIRAYRSTSTHLYGVWPGAITKNSPDVRWTGGQSVAPLRTTGTAYVDAILLTTDCRAFGYLSTKCPMSLSAVGKLARQSVTDTHALAYGQTVLTSVGAPKLYCVVEPRRQQSENLFLRIALSYLLLANHAARSTRASVASVRLYENKFGGTRKLGYTIV